MNHRDTYPSWAEALREGLSSGSTASVLSSAVLSISGEAETGNPARPTNATSQWLWGEEAHRARRLDARHTLVGYLIHHATSLFWATLYEKFRRRDEHDAAAKTLADAAIVAATACFADYVLTPKRFTPGFEHHLSKTALFAVYASFGAGLALATLSAASRRGE